MLADWFSDYWFDFFCFVLLVIILIWLFYCNSVVVWYMVWDYVCWLLLTCCIVCGDLIVFFWLRMFACVVWYCCFAFWLVLCCLGFGLVFCGKVGSVSLRLDVLCWRLYVCWFVGLVLLRLVGLFVVVFDCLRLLGYNSVAWLNLHVFNGLFGFVVFVFYWLGFICVFWLLVCLVFGCLWLWLFILVIALVVLIVTGYCSLSGV